MKKVLVILAPGFEEIEALTPVDMLRRAGAEVTIAGTEAEEIIGRNKIRVVPDAFLDEVMDRDFDLVVLPGGAVGAENLRKDERVKDIIERHNERSSIVSAICAAPAVLSAIGVIEGREVTSHPSVRESLKGSKVSDERVVQDGNIITSQGPGTAMEFAFKLVEVLYGPEKVKEVNSTVLARV